MVENIISQQGINLVFDHIEMHRSILIIPAMGGTLGLYKRLLPMLPAGLPVLSVDLADSTRHSSYFKLPSVNSLARKTIELVGDSILNPGHIIVASCGGTIIALEIGRLLKEQGCAPERLILIDPPAQLPFFYCSNYRQFFLESTRIYIRDIRKIFKARQWLRESNPSYRYRILWRLRSAYFLIQELPCQVSVLLSAEREYLTHAGLFSKLQPQPEFIVSNSDHGGLFRGDGRKDLESMLQEQIQVN